MHEPGGFERMATVSVVAHGVLIAIVLFAPGGWSSRNDEPTAGDDDLARRRNAAGPANGGVTAIGGRAVQEVRPADEKPLREAPRPPAAKTPEMTVPDAEGQAGEGQRRRRRR